jgi:hypothetical protein
MKCFSSAQLSRSGTHLSSLSEARSFLGLRGLKTVSRVSSIISRRELVGLVRRASYGEHRISVRLLPSPSA